jgi:hypothetical protein
MSRCLFPLAGFLCAIALASSAVARPDDKKDTPKLTVDLAGSIDDEKLAMQTPEPPVIVSQKGWEKLAKAWGLKDPPKVDFTKELLIVATTRGSQLNLSSKLDDKGNLQVSAISTRDLRPGFRYSIKSVSREGVKTANGKELPKE